VFSTILSLVFVPAMFMMMDDIGALIWRFAKRLIVSNAESEQAAGERKADHKEPPKIVHSPAAGWCAAAREASSRTAKAGLPRRVPINSKGLNRSRGSSLRRATRQTG